MANLQQKYAEMAQQFQQKGLNIDSIRALQHLFVGLGAAGDSNAGPHPQEYVKLDQPLAENSVRLVVLPVDHGEIARAAAELAEQVEGLLPDGFKCYHNPPKRYHCTVFHTSHPADPRPCPWAEHSGAVEGAPPSQQPGPSPQSLQVELDKVMGVVSGSKPPTVKLERALMADSGTLLLTWSDPDNAVTALRGELRRSFPSATSRQANIIHSSLLRLLTPQQLEPETIRRIQQACDAWTARFQGLCYTPTSAWFVVEAFFSNLEGRCEVLRFAD